MKNTCLLVHCTLSFEVASYKIYKIELVNQFLYFLLFYITSAFTSADIVFYNFLEPNLTFSEKKKGFRHKFSFFNRFTLAPKPLNSQNLLSMNKVFCQGFLNLENLWFYIWVAVDFLISRHKEMALRHLLPITYIF